MGLVMHFRSLPASWLGLLPSCSSQPQRKSWVSLHLEGREALALPLHPCSAGAREMATSSPPKLPVNKWPHPPGTGVIVPLNSSHGPGKEPFSAALTQGTEAGDPAWTRDPEWAAESSTSGVLILLLVLDPALIFLGKHLRGRLGKISNKFLQAQLT